MPVYAGCPNVADCFPKESFIGIDYRDPGAAMQIVAAILSNDSEADYARRLPYLEDARARLFDHFNAASALARLVRRIHRDPHCTDGVLLARTYLNL